MKHLENERITTTIPEINVLNYIKQPAKGGYKEIRRLGPHSIEVVHNGHILTRTASRKQAVKVFNNVE